MWVGLCHLAWQRDLFWVLPEGKAAPKPVREAYGALVAKQIGGEVPNAKKVAETTVGERCSIFLYWAESELRAEERQSNSAIPVPVLCLFGKKAASDFGPVKLRRIQRWFVVPPHRVQAEGRGENPFWTDSKDQEWNHFSINRIRRTRRFGSHQAV